MTASPKSLMGRLGAGLLPESEFSLIVASHFGETVQREAKVIRYGRDGVKAIDARYKDDALISITKGPALTEDDIRRIGARVRSEAAESRECVCRSFVFSGQRVNGFWRYRDRFQLLPAGDGAPEVPYALGWHPLILEFKVRWSPDVSLFASRRADEQTRIVLLLNAFMPHGMTHIGFRSVHRWVVETSLFTDGQHSARTIWASDGYLVPGFADRAEDFSNTDRLPEIPLFTAGSDFPGDGRDPLTLPHYLAAFIDCYNVLKDSDRRAFDRATYWYGHSGAMYQISYSAAFAALVQAIEALVPRGDKSRSTSRFIEFLTSFGFNKKTCETFYEIRSEILHGSRVLFSDLEGLFSMGHPGIGEFFLTYDECARAARHAMRYWLAQQVTRLAVAPGDQLDTSGSVTGSESESDSGLHHGQPWRG